MTGTGSENILTASTLWSDDLSEDSSDIWRKLEIFDDFKSKTVFE